MVLLTVTRTSACIVNAGVVLIGIRVRGKGVTRAFPIRNRISSGRYGRSHVRLHVAGDGSVAGRGGSEHQEEEVVFLDLAMYEHDLVCV